MSANENKDVQTSEYDRQTVGGALRLFVFGIALVIGFGWYGSMKIDGLDPAVFAERYKDSFWLLKPVLTFVAYTVNVHSLRYMIAPLAAIICILFAGALFVDDIYALQNLKLAFHYVLASMFGDQYPHLTVDKGERQLKKNELNLIDKIGGPGLVEIQPGNAVMFRKLHGPSVARVAETHFLAPFEAIAEQVSLDEQQGEKESMSAMTRDGIKVVIKDIHYRFRIKQQEQRSADNPYPFSEDAIRSLTFNLTVGNNGTDPWRMTVERAVTGTIGEFVSSHTIDYLTAPRTHEYNPRLELKSQLFVEGVRKRLSDLGAELLWVDVGHVEIEDSSVDELRTNLWSAEWAGDASSIRAYGDAVRQAYHELGRAEAQADLIMSIAGALSNVDLSTNPAENIRKILLSQTAQLLNTMALPAPGTEEKK